jgi:hypothetical protein
MKCMKRETLRAFIDDELSKRQKDKVQTHLLKCNDCKEELKRTKDDIQFINTQIENLDPDFIPQKMQISFGLPQKRMVFGKLIFAPIKVPVVVLMSILLIAIVIFLSSNIIPLALSKLSGLAKQTERNMYIVSENIIQSFSADLDLNEFEPVKNPQILVLKESNE